MLANEEASASMQLAAEWRSEGTLSKRGWRCFSLAFYSYTSPSHIEGEAGPQNASLLLVVPSHKQEEKADFEG
ncbi:hypothetical protein GOP47_0011704 [Adiantum capillus-veneris]|uniref:Uncharacterized protein n=1 Tax=Adiantum capillus-veneris TaxID=13818 RepID=A0A9D4ZI33_ADICA|nr:hypothetical protein GOP47_0011704 [Adiantum capillus-veneris]